MKFALCNEMFQNRSMEEVCAIASRLGYHGLELAPFTLAARADAISADQRRQIRQTVRDYGLEVVGLHWLLAGTTGIHITTADHAIRQRTQEYFGILLELCRDLGGRILVIGSPKQRNLDTKQLPADGWQRAVELFISLVDWAEKLHVTLCLEPLSPVETNFVNTVAEGLRMVREINHPNFKIHLDVKAMCSEKIPVPDIIRSVKIDEIGHFHVNDENLYGPGMGKIDYSPISAAINEIGWDRWLSLEVFKYDPDPETIAQKSIEYLRSFWPDSQPQYRENRWQPENLILGQKPTPNR